MRASVTGTPVSPDERVTVSEYGDEPATKFVAPTAGVNEIVDVIAERAVNDAPAYAAGVDPESMTRVVNVPEIGGVLADAGVGPVRVHPAGANVVLKPGPKFPPLQVSAEAVEPPAGTLNPPPHAVLAAKTERVHPDGAKKVTDVIA